MRTTSETTRRRASAVRGLMGQWVHAKSGTEWRLLLGVQAPSAVERASQVNRRVRMDCTKSAHRLDHFEFSVL